MTGSEPMAPHHTGVEIVVQLGPTATVATTVEDGQPFFEITWGSITVLLVARSTANNEPIVACDVDRARDLHTAATTYLAAIEALWKQQQSAADTIVNDGPDRDGAHG